jgi:hypothetical protein
MEFDVKAAVDEFNTLKFELEDDQKGVDDNIRDEPLTLNYVHLITDWGKYFGIEGFGIMSTVGIDDFGYKETVDFTGINLEYSDAVWLGGAPSLVLDFDVMGIVKPYYAMHLDTFGAGTTASSNGASWIMGAVVDVAPVTAEVYFASVGDLTTAKGKQELNKTFGAEAVYTGEVADGVELTAGGYVNMVYTLLEEYNTGWGFGAGVSAYGATLNVSMAGMFLGSDASKAMDDPSYALAKFGVDGEYAILDWMGVNAAMLMYLGDYADAATVSGETFIGAEFGVTVMPGKVKYGMGYIVTSEDAEGEYSSVMAEDIPMNGGIYFIGQINY